MSGLTRIEMDAMRAIEGINRKMKDQREIDWEQRRYEIARDVLPQLMKMEIPSGDFIDYEMKLQGKKPIVKGEYSLFMRACIEMAIDCADLLIDRLKGGSK